MKSSGIGGQAVLEGVMMKNHEKYAVAVRKPDKEIAVDIQEYKGLSEKSRLFKLPVLRGMVAFIDSMVVGIRSLTYSSTFYEEEEKKEKKSQKESKTREAVATGATIMLSVLLAIGVFMVLPYFLSRLLTDVISSNALLLVVEAVIKLLLFIGYIGLISQMQDIHRVFMYHGAEHKTINCIEHGYELTVKNVKKQSKSHKRCGTSFILYVLILSIIFFMFIDVKTVWMRYVLRILLVPVIAGVAYEFIRLAGKTDNKVINALSKPGLLMQALTTREPDDEMIEVAIKSVEAVFDWKAYLEENFPRSHKHEKKKSEKKQNVVNETEKTGIASDEIAASLEPEEDDEVLMALDHYFSEEKR